MPDLFDPLTVGDLHLPHRVLMAPLTRCRCDPGRVPSDLMRQYYVQRASAGLIFSEATSVDPMGVGYPDTPGIWSAEQVAGWRRITHAVHAAGGRMLLQLWHVGRVSDPVYLDGRQPVAPSAIAATGHVSLVRPPKDYEVPRALDREELPGVIAAYRKGAENAKAAGFDGVEIHGANGYLLDQFLQTGSNHRTDDYGGPIENRARLMLEVTDAVIGVWGGGRVGMHLAPRGNTQGIHDDDPAATWGYVATELGKRQIAFLASREKREPGWLGPQLKRQFGGIYIANQSFNKATATDVIAAGEADAVLFGVPFIANPDLPARFRADAPLNDADPSTFYARGPHGYTDYPAMA